jgi:hypothetical protein
LPRQGHLVAADPSRTGGSPSDRSSRRTVLLAAWALLLAALFAVALRSATDDAFGATAGRDAALTRSAPVSR